ncbi:hypothetical protein ALC53_09619 [Atta colombica]|uniref:Uncharacterized protein n=1 Tax=Atta colombica TaxID=520822 RepID=A0A151I234_9HYME|nr:hypothetical protein ALC53_09619 [Atta colombica]
MDTIGWPAATVCRTSVGTVIARYLSYRVYLVPVNFAQKSLSIAASRTMKISCILCDVIVIRKTEGARTKTSESTDGRFDSVRRMEADPMSQTALRIRGMLNNAYHAERPKSTMERSVEDEGRIAILLLTAFVSACTDQKMIEITSQNSLRAFPVHLDDCRCTWARNNARMPHDLRA